MELKIGDVVELKSGGPWMTVISMDSAVVKCQWFQKSEVFTGEFPSEALKIREDEEPVYLDEY